MDTDYVYWSSPVIDIPWGSIPNTLAGKCILMMLCQSGRLQEYSGTVMAPGKGYIVRGPEFVPYSVAPAPFPASFIGVPNNGTITILLRTGTSNLIGNPYPSALDADSFLTANSAVLEDNLFLTHNTAIQLAANIINGSGFWRLCLYFG
jgi:hypothetical protein